MVRVVSFRSEREQCKHEHTYTDGFGTIWCLNETCRKKVGQKQKDTVKGIDDSRKDAIK